MSLFILHCTSQTFPIQLSCSTFRRICRIWLLFMSSISYQKLILMTIMHNKFKMMIYFPTQMYAELSESCSYIILYIPIYNGKHCQIFTSNYLLWKIYEKHNFPTFWYYFNISSKNLDIFWNVFDWIKLVIEFYFQEILMELTYLIFFFINHILCEKNKKSDRKIVNKDSKQA